MKLARADRFPEDVVVQAVVIPERELRNVERQGLRADLVERADHAALQDRPEAFDGLRVDRADDVLALGVIDAPVPLGVQMRVCGPLVGADERNAVGYRFRDEGPQDLSAGRLDHARDDVPAALDRAGDDGLVHATPDRVARRLGADALVLVGPLAADEGLIDLNDAQ